MFYYQGILLICLRRSNYNLRTELNGKNVLVSNKAFFEPQWQCGYVMTMYFSSPSCNGYRLTLVINSVQFRGSLHHISETGDKVWSYKSYCNRRRFLRKLYKYLADFFKIVKKSIESNLHIFHAHFKRIKNKRTIKQSNL